MRDRIEIALGRWGRLVYRRAGGFLVGILLALALLATQLAHFRMDASSEGFFRAGDPIRVAYEAFQEDYGRDVLLLVLLRPAQGVFERGFLERLRVLHGELEAELPHLVEVTSLVNARSTRGVGDRLDVGELMEEWPETPEALAELEARARANPIYRNNLLSEDGRLTAIAIETQAYVEQEDFDPLAAFDTSASEGAGDGGAPRLMGEQEDREVADALYAVLDRHRSDDLEIFATGTPLFNSVLAQKMREDMARFTALSMAIIALTLALAFGRAGAVALPLLTVALTVVATLSIMAASDTPLMPPTQIIPSFLLAVGVGGAVHLLTIFYQARRRGDAEEDAVAFALAHSGLAIIMASLTTAAGLLSFIPAALAPIGHFGIFTPIGVLLGLFLTLTLIPALIGLLPMGVARQHSGRSRSQRLLVRVGALSVRYRGRVLAAWSLLLLASVAGLLRVSVGHDMVKWFPEGDPLREATLLMNERMGGATSFEVVVSTGMTNGFHEPALLRKLEAIERAIGSLEVRGMRSAKTLALTDVVRETHQALNENRPDFYEIPQERALVAQELLLFENSGSDDVEDFVDAQFSSGRLSARLPFAEGALIRPYLDALTPEVARILGPELRFEITGFATLFGSTIAAALRTMLTSYVTALIVITALMIALIGRFRLGLLSMLPNLAPIVVALGLMGWLGVPLDMFTLMIGSIVLGLAVDDTIHFFHNFRRYYEESGSIDAAVERTLLGTGQAMLFTTLVLAGGFLVYTQAYMQHLFHFGVLVSVAISLAFVADVTLAPALVASFLGRSGGPTALETPSRG